ncbi:hypothetical protein [Bacillus sp. DNRA2]|uniref:hypothetical protein n=1 Tax=Bacillus sp. DNRA2 TaxID=2723053 RepID=UPI001B7D2185|nr:hypothetical protein [Bacillus sp. DNRA2]
MAGAGFDPNAMNNDNIPIELVNMGLEKGKDTFTILIREAIWAEKFIGDQYLNNLSTFMKVYRITPKTPYTTLTPWPTPNLKIRETGTTEFQIVKGQRDSLMSLCPLTINFLKGGTWYLSPSPCNGDVPFLWD